MLSMRHKGNFQSVSLIHFRATENEFLHAPIIVLITCIINKTHKFIVLMQK